LWLTLLAGLMYQLIHWWLYQAACCCCCWPQVIVADSFGGADEPVDTLVAALLGVDAQVLGDALRVKEEPTHMLYQAFEEAGTDLAQVGKTKLLLLFFMFCYPYAMLSMLLLLLAIPSL
jgi:hypothetical protein